ncbi:MAG: hypothetical protein RIQ93_663 [Verrucomicrobiota bacterium]|jgi:autotransporter-associated beta strand protein
MNPGKFHFGFVLAVSVGLASSEAQTLYWNTDAVSTAWTSTNWGTGAGGPFTTSWSANTDVQFTANSTVTFATTSIGNVTVDPGVTVTVTAGGTLSSNNAVRTITVGAGSLLTWTSQTVSSGSTTGFTKNGTGAWNLGAMTATNGFTGGFTLNAGTVIVSGDKAFGAGALTVNGGTIQSSGTRSFAVTSLTIGGDFALTGTGSSSWNANANLGSTTRTITNSAGGSGITRSFGGIISGGAGAGLTFGGSSNATTILAGANTYSGGTTLNAGTLQVSGSGTLGSTSGFLAVNAGTLDVNGLNQTVGNLTGSGGTIVNNATGTAARLTIGSGDGGGGNYAGVIADHTAGTGTLALTKTGTGTITLSGTNTYSGGVHLNGGVLGLGASQALGSSGALAFGGGSLQHSSSNTTDYSARISGSTDAIAIDTNGQNVTYASALPSSNTGGLIKSGSGTLTLTGANAYLGGTAVSAGILAVTGGGSVGSSAGAVAVASNSTLSIGSGVTLPNNITLASNAVLSGEVGAVLSGQVGGAGALAGTLAIASGGSIAPGNSAGTLTLANASLTFSSGSTYAWELNSLTTSGPGSNYDLIALTGASTLVTNSVLLVPAFTGAATAPNQGAEFWTTARNWTVVSGNDSSTISGAFLVNNPTWNANGSFSTTALGNNLLLHWTPTSIPEPSTYALILGAAVLAGALWRRPHRRAR